MMSKTSVGLLAWTLLSVGVGMAQASALASPSYTFNRATVIAGARIFADHCSACHAVSSLRYDRLSTDLGMSKAQIKKFVMIPGGANYLGGMEPTMTPADATKWLGTAPPNLSHIVRAKGMRWVYTYLTSFYWDPVRPSGWNNHAFPNVAMPNVLARWGGIYSKHGRLLQPGRLTLAVYHQRAANVVAFLRYASDPSFFQRHVLAPYVLGTLIMFTILAYLLKREYWKDVHMKDDVTNDPDASGKTKRDSKTEG